MTPEKIKEALEALGRIDKEHRERARSLSELANKLIAKRRAGPPRSTEEWLADMDVIKRAAEHLGASHAVNEIRILLGELQ